MAPAPTSVVGRWPPRRAHADDPPDGQADLGDDQQHDEQHGHRERFLDVGEGALGGTYPVASEPAMPRIIAPRKVMGRLRSRPTTAAAYP